VSTLSRYSSTVEAPRPLATVSIDVDPLDVHLAGYGIDDAPRDRLVYDIAVPRLLELLAETGITATFFVIGRDADTEGPTLRRIAEAGHEVAGHSEHHPVGLTTLAATERSVEIEGSRGRISQAVGREVLGFRAPNWDVDSTVLEALAAAGYRYDASAYPSLLHVPARIVQALRGRDRRRVARMRPWPMTMRRRPFRVSTPAGPIWEFPVSVAPYSTIPLYHTVRYVAIGRGFERHLRGQIRRRHSISYALHALDVLGLAEDGIDARLARHPGMDRSLEAKRELVRATLGAIADGFSCQTFAERTAALDAVGEAVPA
jgi:peptidoglycan/xylan/chitin deacetylase (PgdA/CDA1 family)